MYACACRPFLLKFSLADTVCLLLTFFADDGTGTGILDFLTDPDDPVATALCEMCEFRIGEAGLRMWLLNSCASQRHDTYGCRE